MYETWSFAMSSMLNSFLSRLDSGEFDIKLDFPAAPTQPRILRKEESELSPGQLRALPNLRVQYQAAFEDFKKNRIAYLAETERLELTFKNELARAFGVANHPKLDTMFKIASRDSYDRKDFVQHFAELAELVS
jgi:hypothetical protein